MDDKPNVKTLPTHRTTDLGLWETWLSIQLLHIIHSLGCFLKCQLLILACRTKPGITYMECFQGRSSSVVPRRLLPFFLPLFFCLSSSHSTLPSLFVSVSFCGAAKSVMVTALPRPTVGVERSSRPFDTHALASSVLGRYSVLHPGSPHLSSGPWWGDNPLPHPPFPDENTRLLPSTVPHLMISSCSQSHNQLI